MTEHVGLSVSIATIKRSIMPEYTKDVLQTYCRAPLGINIENGDILTEVGGQIIDDVTPCKCHSVMLTDSPQDPRDNCVREILSHLISTLMCSGL